MRSFVRMTALVAGFAVSASANAAWFTRVWQTDDGLPNNQVTAIAQGTDGYLWVGTAMGLARFDGIQFVPFPYVNSGSNDDQGVSALLPARDGGLWIMMRRSQVVHLGPDFSSAVSSATNLPDPRPVAWGESKTGDLWLAYPDSAWLVRNGHAVRQASLQDLPNNGYPGGFAWDTDGNLWLAKGTGVYILRDGRFTLLATTQYKAHLAASHTGGVWVAAGKQLFKCYGSGRLQDCGSFFPADSHAGTTAVMEDHTGALWIGTSSGGLFRYDGSGFEKVETSHPDILSLAEDREGNIWAGTAGGGLNRISARTVELTGLDNGSSRVAIQSVCEDTNGVQWGATQGGLLVTCVNGLWCPAFTNAPWTNAVDCVAADRHGAIWIGLRNCALYRWGDGQFTFWDANDGMLGHVTLALLPASSGDVWIAGQAPNALQCLHDGALRSLHLSRTAGRITALAEDAAGAIWVGTDMGLLFSVHGSQLVDQTPPGRSSNRSILSLYPTTDGALWIGYEGAGLGRLNHGQFSRVDAAQGLFDDYILQIAGENDGWLWFGGERGIFKVRRSELEAVMDGKAAAVRSIGYGRNEGLFSMEAASANVSPYVSPGAFKGSDGRLRIPLRKALAVVDPSVAATTNEPPVSLLSQVTMDGRVIAAYGGINAGPDAANLALSHTTLQLPSAHRHLKLDFTAINLRAPEDIRFRYQLVGYDSDWIEADGKRTAEYSRLQAGRYEFRVEAANGVGEWNETPATLFFNVPPFFWQTWWFRVGALFLFTSCIIAIVRYISFRRLQTEMRLLEQRAALDKERARIARDLHDDLGCSLNKVALTLDLTQRGLDSGETVNGKILRCSGMVRQVAKSVDEIVWAINPRNDTLRYMVDYISQFAVEFLHAAEISCRVDLPDNVSGRVVSPEARHNLFLVVKEALNNIVRHARATEVQLHVTATDDEVSIVVADNGRGFERAPDNASADGLRNMRQRMEEIGGQFEIETRPGAGTRITLRYRWPRETAGNPNMPYHSQS